MVNHAVPVRVIGQLIGQSGALTLGALRDFLLHHYKRGVITFGEDQLLNQRLPGEDRSLKQRMPTGWHPWENPFARYAKAGIIGSVRP